MIPSDTCRSCHREPVAIIKVLDDPAEPYRVCRNCYERLLTHSLRPREWYNLSSIHGRLNEFLGEDCYNENDGKALRPATPVSDAAMYPCPTFDEAVSSPAQLLTYI